MLRVGVHETGWRANQWAHKQADSVQWNCAYRLFLEHPFDDHRQPGLIGILQFVHGHEDGSIGFGRVGGGGGGGLEHRKRARFSFRLAPCSPTPPLLSVALTPTSVVGPYGILFTAFVGRQGAHGCKVGEQKDRAPIYVVLFD